MTEFLTIVLILVVVILPLALLAGFVKRRRLKREWDHTASWQDDIDRYDE